MIDFFFTRTTRNRSTGQCVPGPVGRAGGTSRGAVRSVIGTWVFGTAVLLCLLASPEPGALKARVISVPHHISYAGWQARNPLLPKRIHLTQLWPDMSLVQKAPVTGPAGWRPVYSLHTWATFQKRFGTRQNTIFQLRLSDRIQLASDMLDAAHKTTSPRLKRLLALRAFALSFRYYSGSRLAQKAQSLYLKHIDDNNLVQVAPVWTMANYLAFLQTTSQADRRRIAFLAEAANVQLVMLLLNAGQVEDAARVVAHLVIHETLGVRADHPLMSAMNTARILVSQTRMMMDFLAGKYPKIGIKPQAAMAVYLYTRFIRPVSNVRAWLENRWRIGAIGQLSRSLTLCKTDIQAEFTAGKDLDRAADQLPWGILRDRVDFAALQHYRTFLNSKATRWDRIHRTLAKIAIQHLIERGARPNPTISPLSQYQK